VIGPVQRSAFQATRRKHALIAVAIALAALVAVLRLSR
jgi:hypothetical protein